MTGQASREDPFIFTCCGATLVGLVHHAFAPAERGVLVVVGGPQYRAGSHRQFVLLSRALADGGVPVMRFDYRGIGDSEGPFLGFETIDQDIAAAIGAFFARCPGMREVVLWGLCDAASAILFYASSDPRVAGIVLLNPWARTQKGEARAYLRHYYWGRLSNPEFWRALFSGRLRMREAVSSFVRIVAQRFDLDFSSRAREANFVVGRPLPERMAEGLTRFKGPVLLVMSGQDLTAHEFEDATRASRTWQRLMAAKRLTRRDLEAADHTFSRRVWHDRVVEWTHAWIRSW